MGRGEKKRVNARKEKCHVYGFIQVFQPSSAIAVEMLGIPGMQGFLVWLELFLFVFKVYNSKIV